MVTFKLRRLLAMNEMTQKELSDKTGIRLPTLSAISNNKIKEIPVSVLDKICCTLHCQPNDWIEFKDEEKKP